MKKTVCIILSALLAATLLSGCDTGYKEPPEVGFLVAEQFSDYKLGTIEELVPKDTITELIDSPIVKKYSSVEDGLDALLNKKLHGFVLPAVYASNELEKSDYFKTTEIPFIEKKLCALSLSASDFVLPADAAITAISNNGTMQKIANAYSPYADEADPYIRPSDYDKLDGRVIKIGICGDEAYPYNYHGDDGALTGINVDVAYEIAKGVHAELEIKEYAEDELMNALDSGEVDMIMSQFFEDEENPISTKYIYSHSYCDASTYILIRGPFASLAEKKAE